MVGKIAGAHLVVSSGGFLARAFSNGDDGSMLPAPVGLQNETRSREQEPIPSVEPVALERRHRPTGGGRAGPRYVVEATSVP